jgi:hypothetical protein
MKKFSAGGAQGRYDRRMADIEKDYAKAAARKTGKAAEVAEAKRQQRIADAKDDLAKRTGADRTATRAAERAAESNLTKTRKYGAPKAVTTEAPTAKVTDSLGAITAPKSGLATAAKKPAASKPKPKPKSSPADTARNKFFQDSLAKSNFRAVGEKTKIGASNAPSDQGFSSKSKTLGASKDLKTNKPSTTATGPSTKRGLNPDSIAGRISSGDFFKSAEAYRKAQAAKYPKATFKKGGSVPPQPTAADRARSKAQLDSLKKAKPTAAEGKVAGSANRSEGPGYKKGGKMATKFGAAMKKKSADTKGRAMVKKAGGGKCYASGGLVAGHKSADGCAVRGKTKGKMLARGGAAKMRGRDSYGGAEFKKGGKTC